MKRKSIFSLIAISSLCMALAAGPVFAETQSAEKPAAEAVVTAGTEKAAEKAETASTEKAAETAETADTAKAAETAKTADTAKAAEKEDSSKNQDSQAGVECSIEEGSYVIRIPDASGDLGWVADDMAQDNTVVKLAEAGLNDGKFVIRYAPAGDGDVTVSAKHYTGIACDQMYTWDLKVADGAVKECTGGSYTASPDDKSISDFLTGKWLEQQAPFTQMTIEKNEERGFQVEIAAPLTHGAYIFKATVYHDCDVNGLVYDKGKFWNVAITADDNTELGEADVAGAAGFFSFAGDEEHPKLEWHNDQSPENIITFEQK